jgi:amino acid permease
MSLYKDFLLPSGLLAGAIIGAGVFALPYVFLEAGLPVGFGYLVLAAAVYTFAHAMYADVILRTPERHRFPGYIRQYLGEGSFWLSIFMAVVEMMFVLVIYLILSVSFTKLLGGTGAFLGDMALFWAVGSLFIILGVRGLAAVNFWITGGIAAIILFIFLFSLSNWASINSENILPNWPEVFLPLAPILFALSGRVAISALTDYARSRPEPAAVLRRSIVAGTLFSAAIYGFFVLGVVALSPAVSEDAVTGLAAVMPAAAMALVGVLGILSLVSSYGVVGFDVKNILRDDLNFPPALAFAAVFLGPPMLYLAGIQELLPAISFVGGIFLALEGIFIALMWHRANATLAAPLAILPRWAWIALPISVFVFGIALVNEVVKLFD